MIREAQAFADAGGGTIVDVTPPDIGRDPQSLKRVSEAAGLHVVMGTGRYIEPNYERGIWSRSAADIAREFIRDIEEGIDGVRAGINGEIGTHGPAKNYFMTPAEERVHRAAAKAHVATGVAITTHAMGSPLGLQQLDVFEEEGVDLRCVAVGHSDYDDDWPYHEAVLRRGAFLQFDLIRGTTEWETERQVRMACRVLEAGFVDRLLLSQDLCGIGQLKAGGGVGWGFLITDFVKRLEREGLSTPELHQVLSANPQRLLEGSAGVKD